MACALTSRRLQARTQLTTPCCTDYSTFYFLQEWFVERRGFANGVCFAGTAAGGLVLPFILNALLERYGAALTLRALVCCTPFSIWSSD